MQNKSQPAQRKDLSALQREICQLINISWTNDELTTSVESALKRLTTLTNNPFANTGTITLDGLNTKSKKTQNYSSEQGKSSEIERINSQLAGFDWKKSRAWAKLTFILGGEATLTTLRYIAQDISLRTNVKIGRDEKRRKCVLVKWFDDNWERLAPSLSLYRVSGEKAYCNGIPLNE